MTAARFDAVIAGGGIVGAACAAALTAAGMKLALVERDALGSGATAAGMGHIVVMDDSPAQFALTRCSHQLWQALASQLGPRAEYEACGTLCWNGLRGKPSRPAWPVRAWAERSVHAHRVLRPFATFRR
jgi:glycine/D-amino acid oxidase-like deaminating enzyme